MATYTGDTTQTNNVLTGSVSTSDNVLVGSVTKSNNVLTGDVTTQFLAAVEEGIFDNTFDATFE